MQKIGARLRSVAGCGALVAASLLSTPTTATAAPSEPANAAAQPPPKGTPPAMARAWTKLKCRFGALDYIQDSYGGKPTPYWELDCHPKGYGYQIEQFKNKKLGRAWWLDYWLECGSYIAVKGNLVITSQDGPGSPYEYDDTLHAAKRIGGRVLEGGEDCASS